MVQGLLFACGAAIAAVIGTMPSCASGADVSVKIGVLTDMSGPYSRLTGDGSAVAAKLAADDCLKAQCAGMKIEVLSADHQNKTDVAVATARRWFDEEKVDVLTDLVNASVQLAIQALVKDRNRVALYPGGTTRLTNEDCAREQRPVDVGCLQPSRRRREAARKARLQVVLYLG